MIENDEKRLREQAMQALQAELQAKQQEALMKQQTEIAKMEQEDKLNQRDNETKVLIATIQAESSSTPVENVPTADTTARLEEQAKEFAERLALDKEKLAFDKEKAQRDAQLKEKQINKKPSTSK